MQITQLGQTLKTNGIFSGAGVPCSVFKPLVNYMTVDPELDYISAASEGEAVAIAAGLTAAGRPAFSLMQNSGLGNAVNPITSMLYIYRIPVMLLVSQRGEPGKPDEPQHELMGRITEELARLCELRTHFLEPDTFADTLGAAMGDGVPAAWICRRGLLEGGPKAPSIELRLQSAAVRPGNEGVFEPTLGREQVLRELLPLLNRGLEQGTAPAVICTTGKLSRELYELDDRDHTRRNRFYMVGSLGCAAGFGLGVARACQRKVLVLDGDGAILMKLGSLATIGHLAPPNLHHVIFDNGAHESTGGQPTSSSTADFAVMALAAGYRCAETASELPAALETLSRHLEQDGPTLLRIAIRTGSRADLGRPTLKPRDGLLRFSAFLAGRND